MILLPANKQKVQSRAANGQSHKQRSSAVADSCLSLFYMHKEAASGAQLLCFICNQTNTHTERERGVPQHSAAYLGLGRRRVNPAAGGRRRHVEPAGETQRRPDLTRRVGRHRGAAGMRMRRQLEGGRRRRAAGGWKGGTEGEVQSCRRPRMCR